ncbi:hypothetical protein LMG33810_000164 [Carnimonas sp. LMG 33810]
MVSLVQANLTIGFCTISACRDSCRLVYLLYYCFVALGTGRYGSHQCGHYP